MTDKSYTFLDRFASVVIVSNACELLPVVIIRFGRSITRVTRCMGDGIVEIQLQVIIYLFSSILSPY